MAFDMISFEERTDVWGTYKEWRRRGVFHRENDMPAVEFIPHSNIERDDNFPRREWWYNGERHRENDLPAIVYGDGIAKEWWHRNKRHRPMNRPAIVRSFQYSYLLYGDTYYYNGELHRDDGGPACMPQPIEWNQWYIRGECYPEEVALFIINRENKLARGAVNRWRASH